LLSNDLKQSGGSLQSQSNKQRLARLLDRPSFPWKKVLVSFSLGQFVLENLLSLRQYSVLQRTKPPKVLDGEISQKVFDESQVREFDSDFTFFFFALPFW
jgi:hypothetical protein